MKITLAQTRIFSNQIERNFSEIKDLVLKHARDSDLIIFPDLALSGYVGKYFLDADYISELLDYNEIIKELSHNIAIIWSNLSLENNQITKKIYFAAKGAFLEPVSSLNLDVFSNELDGYEIIKPYQKVNTYQFLNQKLELSYLKSSYSRNLENKPDIKIILGNQSHLLNEDQNKVSLANETTEIYLNMVGVYNTATNIFPFSGGSYLKTKEYHYELNKNFETEVATFDLTTFKTTNLEKPASLYATLVSTLRYFDEEVFPYQPTWIVGISGGLDSSISLALLVKAFGKKRVIPVTLPSRYTSDQTFQNVLQSVKALELSLKTIEIDALADLSKTALEDSGYQNIPALVDENIQARLRGHLLMGVAGIENGVIINNSNKIEIAIGYSTLYGDTIGAIALLGDLNKLDLINLAQEINQINQKVIIPLNLIPKITSDELLWEVLPSAELASKQVDPLVYGYHDSLIDFLLKKPLTELLKLYLNQKLWELPGFKAGLKHGFDDPETFINDLKKMLRMLQIAGYKRFQMPPIITLTTTAFGLTPENQISQHFTQEQTTLINQILEKKEKL